MLFRWFDVLGDGSDICDDTAYMNIFADFGTRGAPGSFKVFLVDVVEGLPVRLSRSKMRVDSSISGIAVNWTDVESFVRAFSSRPQ